MSALGIYEMVVYRALEITESGPWDVLDLTDVGQVIERGIKDRRGSRCDAAAVSDWLRSLTAPDRQDLIERLNEACSTAEDQDLATASN